MRFENDTEFFFYLKLAIFTESYKKINDCVNRVE